MTTNGWIAARMENEMSHTPKETHDSGPWKFHIGRGKNPSLHITTDGGYRIASSPELSRHKPEAAQQHANIRLMTASPELLEALQNLANAASLVIERWSEGDLADAVNSLQVDFENAQEVITKATSP